MILILMVILFLFLFLKSLLVKGFVSPNTKWFPLHTPSANFNGSTSFTYKANDELLIPILLLSLSLLMLPMMLRFPMLNLSLLMKILQRSILTGSDVDGFHFTPLLPTLLMEQFLVLVLLVPIPSVNYNGSWIFSLSK